MRLTFLGADGTVTGSRHLVEAGRQRVLVDCGLFQGLKQLRLRNRAPLPVPAASIDAVALTHAHLDHSGYLPVLAKQGFAGRILCTAATRDLCGILLPDSGYLQEEEARHANKHGYSRHRPAVPLYTRADAEESLSAFRPIALEQDFALHGLTLRFAYAGHILGAAMALLRDDRTTVLFTGDLGRPHDPIMRPPAVVRRADYLVLESTYGDRLHEQNDVVADFAAVINRTVARGGTLVIPAFAVGRAQLLLHHVEQLRTAGTIPHVPVYLDSPMARDATEILVAHQGEHRLDAAACAAMYRATRIVNDPEESKAIDRDEDPKIVISASGMATGGRVLHHLKRFAPDARNAIVFAGYQAAGSRGAAIIGGAREVKIHGAYVPIRAEVEVLEGLSAHADYGEILDWLGHFQAPPRRTFLVHGEPAAADALRRHIEERLGWTVTVPEYRDTYDLAAG